MNRRILLCLLVFLLLLGPVSLATAIAQDVPVNIITKNEMGFPVDKATIYIDGGYLGLTNDAGRLTLESYPRGAHNVTVMKDGFLETTVTADFAPGATITVVMNWTSSAGKENHFTIIVLENTIALSKVAEADVYLDDQFAGRTNRYEGKIQLDLPEGTHTITVAKHKSGLLNNTSTIYVRPGGTYIVLMSLGGAKMSILDADLFILSLQKEIGNGLVNTLKLSITSFAIGIVIGLFMGIGRTSGNFFYRGISSIYVEGVRGLPLLLQLLFVNFGLPFLISDFMGAQFNIDAFDACVIALSVNSGAYMAEIFKAGIEAVHKGQMEAAQSLGMNYPQSMRYIILPQAFKIVLPALGNEFIALIKDSSIGLVIAVTEIVWWSKTIGVTYYNTFTPLLAAGLVYLMITIPLGKAVQYMEKRYNVNARKDKLPGKKKAPLQEATV